MSGKHARMCVLVRNTEIARKRRGRGASRRDDVSGKRSACVRTAMLRVVWATGLKAVRTEELVMVEVCEVALYIGAIMHPHTSRGYYLTLGFGLAFDPCSALVVELQSPI